MSAMMQLAVNREFSSDEERKAAFANMADSEGGPKAIVDKLLSGPKRENSEEVPIKQSKGGSGYTIQRVYERGLTGFQLKKNGKKVQGAKMLNKESLEHFVQDFKIDK